MAATQFTQNNVNFTIDDNFTGNEKRHGVKGKLTSAYNDYAGYEADDASKLVNAVDIDWNGAQLADAAASFANTGDTNPVPTITTTGELIKAASSPIFAKVA